MMTYAIKDHVWTMPDGTQYSGHAGHGYGLNNPDAIQEVGVGPLPPGLYNLGPWQDGSLYGPSWARLGPLISRLYPDAGNEMYGRNDFAIHGGNGSNPPTDSDGCVIMQHNDRQAVCDSGEPQVTVTL